MLAEPVEHIRTSADVVQLARSMFAVAEDLEKRASELEAALGAEAGACLRDDMRRLLQAARTVESLRHYSWTRTADYMLG